MSLHSHGQSPEISAHEMWISRLAHTAEDIDISLGSLNRLMEEWPVDRPDLEADLRALMAMREASALFAGCLRNRNLIERMSAGVQSGGGQA